MFSCFAKVQVGLGRFGAVRLAIWVGFVALQVP